MKKILANGGGKAFFVTLAATLVLCGFFVVTDASAATTILHPTAAGPTGTNEWSGFPVNDASGKVNAVQSNDGDTSYIFANSNNLKQNFQFPGTALPSGSIINSVTVRVLVKEGDAGGSNKKI